MIDAVLAGLVLVSAVGVAYVVHLARDQAISAGTVRALAMVCGIGLLVMLLTDWPSEVLSSFWADHSILAGILSTVLLVGIVFLVFEEREQREQDRLDEGLTGAGLGGIVDHVVDIEVALSLISMPTPPDQPGWTSWEDPGGKPLRWLRAERTRLHRVGAALGEQDPRSRAPVLDEGPQDNCWRVLIVDQCVRRLLAAMRDWSPLIGVSKNGVVALLAISELRKDLMRLADLLEARAPAPAVSELILSMRQRARVLAYFFEERSGARPHRPEVLATLWPLPAPPSSLQWAADTSSAELFSKKWNDQLRDSLIQLSERNHVGV